jgi:ABC-type sulfate/molybdate transport systems ATPase subunit
MRKRVALAQMLILDPEFLLMDEPFSALDIQTRQLMENELLELWSTDRKSVLFITHDLEEAISLSDRVIVLSAGPETHPIGEFTIDLPRPRDVARSACSRASTSFTKRSGRCSSPVLKAMRKAGSDLKINRACWRSARRCCCSSVRRMVRADRDGCACAVLRQTAQVLHVIQNGL